MARPARRPGNLPAEATSFVGRRRELAEVRKKLTQARLVSLIGPGGVGKTRLAIRVAADLGRGFRDGGWLVELAEVPIPALVSDAVMAALDLRDQAAAGPLALLLSYLRDKELLLVVDNCEHLLDAAARLVTDLMRAAPGVRVIATSREPLSVPGEHVVPVPPLELPAPGCRRALAQLRQNEAVMLFTERAAAASGTFELTAANQAAVVDLCRRLDGLPLAIELAAVRTRVLAPEQILDRLTDRFGLLTGGSRAALPRHQTLRTTIEWSHDLLPPPSARSCGGAACSRAGSRWRTSSRCARPRTCRPPQALDVLSSLVDKSLVMKEETAGPGLLPAARDDARVRPAQAGRGGRGGGDRAALRRVLPGSLCRGRRWKAATGCSTGSTGRTWRSTTSARCCGAAWTAATPPRGLELAASLGWYWITRATTEGIRWLDEFLAAERRTPIRRCVRWAQFMRGFLAVLKADPAAAGPPLHAAVALARPDRAARTAVRSAVHGLGRGEHGRRPRRSAAPARRGRRRGREPGLGYPPGLIAVLQARALNGFFEADLGAVRAAAAEGGGLARETGDLYALEIMLLNLGSAALLAGDLGEAGPLLAEALRIAREIDDRVAQFYLLDALGCHAALSGQARLAARLFGAADADRTGAGASVMPFLAPVLARATETAAAASGPPGSRPSSRRAGS